MLEGILLFLMTVLIFVFTPFTGSLMIPTVVRIILLISLVIFGVVLTIRKKQVFYFLVGVMTVGLAIAVTWLKAAPYLISVVMYFFAFCIFAFTFNILGNRLPLLKFLIKKLFYCMLMTLAVLAVVSFIAFNLNLVPYSFVNLGGFDFYQYYYNPLLGYINPKVFGDQMIGRVAGFMFEPSYQAWFFTTNFFLVDRMVSKKGMPVVLSKTIIFLGAMATLSTAAMLAFAAIFSFQGGMWLLRRLGMKRKMEMVLTWFVSLSVPIAFLLLSSGASSEALGDSSLGDRQGRTESSFLLVASSSPVQLLLGHGSGYVELQDNAKGESNQYVKMFVEQGLILMVLIIAFIVNVTHHQRYYMLATLIFLNSVVIMWTPLFWINILLCKWLAPSPEPAILPQPIE